MCLFAFSAYQVSGARKVINVLIIERPLRGRKLSFEKLMKEFHPYYRREVSSNSENNHKYVKLSTNFGVTGFQCQQFLTNKFVRAESLIEMLMEQNKQVVSEESDFVYG